MAYGKSIELFLANGTADSLIIAELSNWNGKAITIPRIEVLNCSREDFSQAGVFSEIPCSCRVFPVVFTKKPEKAIG